MHTTEKLTIAIPSYNRVQLLVDHIARAGLPNWVHLLVIDNASPEAVVFPPALQRSLEGSGASWEIIRNQANVGGGANILRCFEHVKTRWFLLCGDDDLIDVVALKRLYELLQQNDDAAFVKFSSRFHRYHAEKVGKGTEPFLQEGGGFAHLLFMSSYLFNRTLCLPYLRFGYLMNGAYAPHLAIALLSARQHPFVLASSEGTHANEADASWSPIDVVLSAYYLLDLPLDGSERQGVRRKIYESHNWARELLDLVAMQTAGVAPAEVRYIRSKAIRVHWSFGLGLKKWVALTGLLLSPLLGDRSLRMLKYVYAKAAGRTYSRQFVSRHHGL